MSAEDWMNPREPDPVSLKRLLVPAPPLVTSVKNEGPALVEV